MSESKYRTAIIGPTDTVSGFKALGVEALPATSGAQVIEHLRMTKQHNEASAADAVYAIVMVIEDLLVDVDQAEYAKLVADALPAVVMLPGPEGSKGVALERLRSLAERAVGSAII